MISPQQLGEAIIRNTGLLRAQAQGLTQEETLLQPSFRANCLNWVLGHLAQNRDAMLAALGEPPVFGERGARYRRESEPVTAEGPEVVPSMELLEILEQAQAALVARLRDSTEEEMARPLQVGQQTRTVAERLFFLYFHETYHAGQTELLRQLAGKNDKVI